MAKTLAKIARPTIKGLKEALREYKDGYEAARSDVHALNLRNQELVQFRDESRKDAIEARENAALWRKHSEEWKKKAEDLERNEWKYRSDIDHLKGELNKCLGWIAARMERHPLDPIGATDEGQTADSIIRHYKGGR